jgi:lysozyme family protein
MRFPVFESYAPAIRQRWERALILKRSLTAVDRFTKIILEQQDRYEAIEAQTGVPWVLIAVKHMREFNCDFRGILHNGQQIIGTGRLTTIVPKGRGPFNSWEEAAIDAIKLKELDRVPEWSLERILFEAERFNGFGYWQMKLPSAYVWSGTTEYIKGKYVSDGKFDPEHVDQQLGCAAVLKRLEQSGVRIDPPDLFRASEQQPELEPVIYAEEPDAIAAEDLPPIRVTRPVTRARQDLSKHEIEDVQRVLFKKGYTIVGLADGRVGPDTRLAVRQALELNELPVPEPVVVDRSFAQLLPTLKDKPVAPERANPETQVLVERVPGYGQADKVEKVAWGGGILTGLFAIAQEMLSGFANIWSTVSSVLGRVNGKIYIVIVIAVIAGIIVWARHRKETGKTSFVEGKIR